MGSLSYLSVCSGVEAATQAWHPLGWRPVAFSEIDPFPCEVLHHRLGAGRPMFMPDPAEAETLKDRKARAAAIRAVARIPEVDRVPNFGDMTQFERWPDAAFDVLVGGTPCQDYSVAGQRLGMAGSRGQLTLTYVEIAARYRPRWFVWENVPGVLSSNEGRDFARFLGDISGQSVAVPEGGWKNSGIVAGIPEAYGLAFRVLDAQYVRTRGFDRAVPQRRRRVFVVGHLGDWRRAAAVLFDRESLLGNPPPRREPGQRPAHDVAGSLTGSGRGVERAGETRGQDPVIGLISMAHGQAGAEIALGHGPTLTCNHEAPIIAKAVAFDLRGRDGGSMPEGPHDTANLRAASGGSSRSYVAEPIAFDCLAGGDTALAVGEVPGALHGGTGGGRAAVAFSCKDYGADAADDVSPTMRAMGHGDSHANAGGQLAVAFAENSRAELRLCGGDGQGQPAIALPWAVRRLTPRECERLQGFPDDFLRIPRGNKLAADGPIYKALGNSMAVNVMEWIGQRIDLVDAL